VAIHSAPVGDTDNARNGAMSRPVGYRHTQKTRRKMSESQRRVKAKLREQPLPEQKPCAHCRRVKKAKDFTLRRRKVKSRGPQQYSLHLSSWCRRCESARLAKYRAEQTKKKLSEQWRRAYVNRRAHEQAMKEYYEGEKAA